MKKFYEFIGDAEMFVAKYALAILSLLIFISAVARTIHYPISWTVDAATFLFAWCVFLGGDIAIRTDKLFCIDLLTCRLPQKTQYYLRTFNYIIIALFLIGLIGYGSWLTYTTRMRTFQGIPGFSYSWVTLSVPVGCTMMLMTVILKIKDFIAIILGKVSIETKEKTVTELM